MASRVNYSGLVIAGIGFFLTRFTVTLAVYENPVRFYLAGVVPLVLGLGLAAFGVALTVANVRAALVRRTALWCAAGTVSMLVLIVLTVAGSAAGEMPAFETMRSQSYLSNFLIGGSVGGTLTGLYASRTRSQRDALGRQADRLDVLNRLLRHEVLNSLTAIRGYAGYDGGESGKAQAVIERRSDGIEQTVHEVKHLTTDASPGETSVAPVSVGERLAESVATVTDRHPDARLSVASVPADLTVRANNRLSLVFTHLIENGVVHGPDEAAVDVTVDTTATTVSVSVSDGGPGLPDGKRDLLETGDVGDFDNPGTGFGLYFVRFLTESYRGSIDTDVDDSGTTVTVTLPRADVDGPVRQSGPSALGGVRPAAANLLVALGAALLAGVVYGAAAELLGGSVSVIGVFYGIQDPVVGWITHEFHSVVFGFVFAGLVSLAPARYRASLPAYLAIGAGWGLVLWFLAAGVVSPVWLRLLGIPASIPSLSTLTLLTHLTWGVAIGALTWAGYRYLTPRLSRWTR